MSKQNPFKYFETSPEVIKLAISYYIRFPLSLRNVEDILHERGIEICHETLRFWWNRFGPIFANKLRSRKLGARANFAINRLEIGRISAPHELALSSKQRPVKISLTAPSFGIICRS